MYSNLTMPGDRIVMLVLLALSACQASPERTAPRLDAVATQLVALLPDSQRPKLQRALLGPRTGWPVFRHRVGQKDWNRLVDEYSALRTIDEPGYSLMLDALENRFEAQRR